MSLSVIGSIPTAAVSTEAQKPAAPAATAQPQAATLQPDTVTISAAAHATASAGDADQDGDSH